MSEEKKSKWSKFWSYIAGVFSTLLAMLTVYFCKRKSGNNNERFNETKNKLNGVENSIGNAKGINTRVRESINECERCVDECQRIVDGVQKKH